MKTIIKSFFLAAAFFMLILGGCQDEVVEITQPQADVLSNQSPVVSLIQQTTMSDGSYDNILDNSSCTSLVLPVTVIANEQEVVISTDDDYKLVERIFDESDTDVDVLVIVFPVTIIMSDHTEVIVDNQEDLNDLIEDCVEGGDDLDIECVDFAYPLDISIYDAANQVSDVVTINNDEELFELFESLDESELVSFAFPLTLVLSDGNEVMVTDNEELEDIIEDVADDCDEDDDDDYSDDDVDDTDLVTVLLNGDWAITYFFDEADETAEFNGYVFTFFENGGATAVNGDILVEGTWETYGDDGSLELELDFGADSPLDELEDDWNLIEFDQNIIKLIDVSDDGTEEFLTFERPEENGGDPELTVADVIVEGEWLVANYNDSGVDETANYEGFKFTYAADGSAMATNGTDNVTGTWSELFDSESHKLILDFGVTVPFDEFADDWDVVEFSETRIELKDISGGDGSIDILVFEKL